MSEITNDKKSPGQKAVEARPAFDGPHKASKKKAGAAAGNAKEDAAPAYVVAVTKREKLEETGEPSSEVQHKYDPKELRAKARAFLNSDKIAPEEKKVLADILKDD